MRKIEKFRNFVAALLAWGCSIFAFADTGLKPYEFVRISGGKAEIYIEVKTAMYESINARFSTDGWSTQQDAKFVYIPNEEVWRAKLGSFPVGTEVKYSLQGINHLREKTDWNDNSRKNFSVHIEESKKPENIASSELQPPESLKMITSQFPDGGKVRSNESVRVRVKTNESTAKAKFRVRSSTDHWKTFSDQELDKTDQKNTYEADLGKFKAGKEVEYITYAVLDDGKEIWNRAESASGNYSFKTGKDGYTPSSLKIENQLKSLQSFPKREIDEIPEVKAYLNVHPVYVSVTTSPGRISQLTHVLDSLDLTHVDEVLVCIPMKYGKNGESYTIPTALKRYPKVRFIRPDTDLGPVTKLVPAVEYAQTKDPASIVITVDDDNGYPQGMIDELIAASVLHPNTAIGTSGQNLEAWGIVPFGFPETPTNLRDREQPWNDLSYRDVLEGFGGVAYPAGKVNTALLRNLNQTCRECMFSDDLTIGLTLAATHVDRMRLNTRYARVEDIQQFDYGLGEDALHHGDGLMAAPSSGNVNATKYKIAYQKIMENLLGKGADVSIHWKPTNEDIAAIAHCVANQLSGN